MIFIQLLRIHLILVIPLLVLFAICSKVSTDVLADELTQGISKFSVDIYQVNRWNRSIPFALSQKKLFKEMNYLPQAMC